MEKIEYQDPPPNWTEVIVLWNDILGGPRYRIRSILHWIETAPGGRYHVHGHESTEGFNFRFEDPQDAVLFRLKWL